MSMIGAGLQAKIFTTEFDIRIDLKNGTKVQNVIPIFYWIFGCP